VPTRCRSSLADPLFDSGKNFEVERIERSAGEALSRRPQAAEIVDDGGSPGRTGQGVTALPFREAQSENRENVIADGDAMLSLRVRASRSIGPMFGDAENAA
jgi:hypothetical protein